MHGNHLHLPTWRKRKFLRRGSPAPTHVVQITSAAWVVLCWVLFWGKGVGGGGCCLVGGGDFCFVFWVGGVAVDIGFFGW